MIPVDKEKLKTLSLSEKISYGLDISFKRLVEKTKKEGGELVFADKDGKIIFKKASEL